jgi:DNA polymerase III subunit delta
MKLYHNQLTHQLQQRLFPVWLVFGDEPWQKHDALRQIKQVAQNQGFEELIRFSADDKFDWHQLANEYQAMSLFATRRIIELELSSGKVGEQGAKVLQYIAETEQLDTLLILHGGKLDAPTSNRKWFKALQAVGGYLPLYDLDARAMQQWLTQQIRHYQLSVAPEVLPLLIELFEGNLLALAQELEKLSLLFQHTTISVADAEQLISKQAKFNPFQLIDALLLGNLTRCISVLDQLQQEGSAAGQLIWFIHKEIKQLLMMQQQLAQGDVLSAVFQQHRIWDKRKPLYQQALQQISNDNLKLALARLAQVDFISKTSSDFNPFILLADVCVSLLHGEQMQKFDLNYELS